MEVVVKTFARHRKLGKRGVRPWVEVVESRTLLTTQPLVIASLGDSLTDEYQFYGAATPSSPTSPVILGRQATGLPPQIYLTGRNAAQDWVQEVGADLSSQLSFGNFTINS
jgi:hypothetical protein